MSFWQSLTGPIIGMAPMDGVTDATFRHTVALQGKPDVSFTEFTHVHDVCRGPEFLLDSLVYHEVERPIVAQLYGKDPDLFYQAAHAVCELGFDGLDVNMGCPSRSVALSGSGAGLIRTPDLAHAIMQATRQGIADWAAGQTLERAGLKLGRVEAIQRMNQQRQAARPLVRGIIPLSVKTRLGYDVAIVDRWIEHLLMEQPAVISLHGNALCNKCIEGRRIGALLPGRGRLPGAAEPSCSAMAMCIAFRMLCGACARQVSMVCWLVVPLLGLLGSFSRKRKREPCFSSSSLARGLSRVRRHSTPASSCCSIMLDGSRLPVEPSSLDGCVNIWGGTARDSPMQPRSGPAWFESHLLLMWRRCWRTFARPARRFLRFLTNRRSSFLPRRNLLRLYRCH